MIEKANDLLLQRLEGVRDSGGLTLDQYVRYLSMQYHLTKGVQRYFFSAASHPCMAEKKSLREFLVHFADEEEMHYRIAEADLREIGREMLPYPLDVHLWHAYFSAISADRPFVRLGATCVMENLGSGIGDVAKSLFANSPFINKANSRFLLLHLHETLPHGDEVYDALSSVELDEENLQDLVEGAKMGAILYLRMADWALGSDPLTEAFPLTLA